VSRPRELTGRHVAQEGVTLVELLLAVGIGGLVVPALALAFTTSLTGIAETQAQVSVTADVSLTSAYLTRDVQSSSATTTSLPAGCASLPSSSAIVAGFPGSTRSSVWYVDAERRLVRRVCGVSSDTVVWRGLSPTTAPTVLATGRGTRLDVTDDRGGTTVLQATRRTP
jgi:hypothetical protein